MLIWYTNDPNVHIRIFRKPWSLILRCFFPVSILKPGWNLKPLWNVVPFRWQFTWRFHCGNFSNNSMTPLYMCKCYLLINANLINAKKMLRYWFLFKQKPQDTCALVSNFNDYKPLYFTAGIYYLHGKLAVVCNFTLVNSTENLHQSEFHSVRSHVNANNEVTSHRSEILCDWFFPHLASAFVLMCTSDFLYVRKKY